MTGTPDSPADLGEVARPSASRGDTAPLAAALQSWLAATLEPDAAPAVSHLSVPTASGMSSDTVLFDASWRGPDGPVDRRLVARLAPEADAMPVFPGYDLGLQAQVMRTVADRSAVPVPAVPWYEPSPEPLGREFLVMERADGLIPPDVMPYNFESWVFDATDTQRRTLQDGSIAVLAGVHGIAEPWAACPSLAPGGGPMGAHEALRSHFAGVRAYYEWAAADARRSPLIERGLDELERSLPSPAGPAVLCWGDARIGNIVYRDFRPAAVLDWEMAALGPREMDLGWMIFLHRFFEDIAAAAGLPGLPGMLRRADVADSYEQASGHRAQDLEWHIAYAAVRQAIIMYRIQCRTVAFGQAEAPDDPDAMIMHRAGLEEMLDGAYWPRVDAAGRAAGGREAR